MGIGFDQIDPYPGLTGMMYGDIIHTATAELFPFGENSEEYLDLTPMDEFEEKKFLPSKWMHKFITKELAKRLSDLRESIALNGQLTTPPVYPKKMDWKANAGDLFIIDDYKIGAEKIP